MLQFLYGVLVVLAAGALAALLIFISHKFFAGKGALGLADEIAKLLPGINCGACGFAGCAQCAQEIANKKASSNACKICTAENRAKIEALLQGGTQSVDESNAPYKRAKCGDCKGCPNSETTVGKKEEEKKPEPKKIRAVVHCQGGYDCEFSNVYVGEQSCKLANSVCGGNLMCDKGCLGFGDCIKICPVNAIELVNGRAFVTDKCIACGKCIKTCPRGLINFEKVKKANVRCIKTIDTRCCKRECIRCGECAKICKFKAITKQEDGSYKIDAEKCVGCRACTKVCPNKCIDICD